MELEQWQAFARLTAPKYSVLITSADVPHRLAVVTADDMIASAEHEAIVEYYLGIRQNVDYKTLREIELKSEKRADFSFGGFAGSLQQPFELGNLLHVISIDANGAQVHSLASRFKWNVKTSRWKVHVFPRPSGLQVRVLADASDVLRLILDLNSPHMNMQLLEAMMGTGGANVYNPLTSALPPLPAPDDRKVTLVRVYPTLRLNQYQGMS